jgi:predicted nucleic acid-binding protein
MDLPAGAEGARRSALYVVIDASVWASSLLPGDSNHGAARDWIGAHLGAGGRLVAPVLLVVEIAATIARVTGSPSLARSAAAHLYAFDLIRLVAFDQGLVNEATALAATLGLRGMDSFYVATARRLGISLVTLDSEQLTRPAGLISTIRP